MFYSQNYIQGKNGIILCCNSEELIMDDAKQSEQNINDLMYRVGQLKDNSLVPISIFYTQMDSMNQTKLKIISSRIIHRFPKGIIKSQYFIPKDVGNNGCSEKSMIMLENFIEHCIEQKVLKEI